MAKIRAVGLCLALVGAVGAAVVPTALAAEDIYKVEGKKLEAGEKKAITIKAKTEFVFTGTGPLNVKLETKCKKLKLDAAEEPVIVGGVPGRSEKEKLVFGECTATVGGVKCEKAAAETYLLDNELVVISAPASKTGKIGMQFAPARGEAFMKLTYTKCGTAASSTAEPDGRSAAGVTPEKMNVTEEVLVWNAAEEITETMTVSGMRDKTGLEWEGKPFTITGEAILEVGGKEFGIF